MNHTFANLLIYDMYQTSRNVTSSRPFPKMHENITMYPVLETHDLKFVYVLTAPILE